MILVYVFGFWFVELDKKLVFKMPKIISLNLKCPTHLAFGNVDLSRDLAPRVLKEKKKTFWYNVLDVAAILIFFA